ncbi:hypothetical protein DL98DRAFT_234413 [Cadophora sp. DSE1049]|nr:hypothetical protein DL98DRAFT_234413 [Cadophora sp. DSE1049]
MRVILVIHESEQLFSLHFKCLHDLSRLTQIALKYVDRFDVEEAESSHRKITIILIQKSDALSLRLERRVCSCGVASLEDNRSSARSGRLFADSADIGISPSNYRIHQVLHGNNSALYFLETPPTTARINTGAEGAYGVSRLRQAWDSSFWRILRLMVAFVEQTTSMPNLVPQRLYEAL